MRKCFVFCLRSVDTVEQNNEQYVALETTFIAKHWASYGNVIKTTSVLDNDKSRSTFVIIKLNKNKKI